MANTEREIASPEELAEWTEDFRSQNDMQSPQHIRLYLLAPLSNPEVLTANLETIQPQTRDSEGNPMGPEAYRSLKLEPLGKEWRAAWAKAPVAVDKIVFDISLPKRSGFREQDVYWHTEGPKRSGALDLNEILPVRLAITMATTMSMRSSRSIQFEMADVENMQDRATGPFEGLKKALQDLSNRRIGGGADQ